MPLHLRTLGGRPRLRSLGPKEAAAPALGQPNTCDPAPCRLREDSLALQSAKQVSSARDLVRRMGHVGGDHLHGTP